MIDYFRQDLLLFFTICLVLSNSCERDNVKTKDELFWQQTQDQPKKDQSKLIRMQFDWGLIEVNGIRILGKYNPDLFIFLKDYDVRVSQYLTECGFLSTLEQKEEFSSYDYGFLEVVRSNHKGDSTYTIINIEISEIIDKNMTIKINDQLFDQTNPPYFNNLFPKVKFPFLNFIPDYISIDDGFSDDGVIFYFNKQGRLSRIEYKSPC